MEALMSDSLARETDCGNLWHKQQHALVPRPSQCRRFSGGSSKWSASYCSRISASTALARAGDATVTKASSGRAEWEPAMETIPSIHAPDPLPSPARQGRPRPGPGPDRRRRRPGVVALHRVPSADDADERRCSSWFRKLNGVIDVLRRQILDR